MFVCVVSPLLCVLGVFSFLLFFLCFLIACFGLGWVAAALRLCFWSARRQLLPHSESGCHVVILSVCDSRANCNLRLVWYSLQSPTWNQSHARKSFLRCYFHTNLGVDPFRLFLLVLIYCNNVRHMYPCQYTLIP